LRNFSIVSQALWNMALAAAPRKALRPDCAKLAKI